MHRFIFLFGFSLFLFSSCTHSPESTLAAFKSEAFSLSITSSGYFSQFTDLQSGTNYLSQDTLAPIISLRINDEIVLPQKASVAEDILTISFPNEIQAQIKLEQKPSHINLELISMTQAEQVELIVWGPYPTTINKVIGETVGVVQGETFTVGIQALNPKTLGGYPWKENDHMPQLDILDQDDYSDLSEKDKRYVLYRVEAAKPTAYGSSLQAFCRDRSSEREIKNLNHENYIAPSFDDGGFIGSKIALFGCPVEQTLEALGKIEIAEGLPHPQIEGTWTKLSPKASAAYLILEFGIDNIQEAIELTQQAGLSYLYHPEPFVTWGHFKLNETYFPKGTESLRQCVEMAEKQGITVGLHTLSNFITTNDPYVTPVPDERLAKVGSTIILEAVNETQNEIPIESPTFFNQFKNNHLKTVMIDQELIRYGSVSEKEPWKLLDCQRGAFETKAATHAQKSTISKLTDHGYKVFLTNNALSKEVAENLAKLYNEAGLRQISFDGIEGNQSTGMGNYAEINFAKTWYDNLNEDVKSHYIADASRTSHFFWHIYTRMNWGEPWYDGFRESQTEYRMKNQPYFKRNLMPAMLGWFLMKPETSLEDIEWLLARSAAFDAGYAFVTKFETVQQHGQADRLLQLLGDWEKLRMADAFKSAQKQQMEDINNEFTLERVGDAVWNWTPVFSGKFEHAQKVRQPGEPLYSTFEFEHQGPEQTLQFILSAVGSDVSGITMELDNFKQLVLPVTLKAGEHIKYAGKEIAIVYDSNWNKINEISIASKALNLSEGKHSLTFDCKFTGEEGSLKIEVRMMGVKEKVNL